MMKWFTAVTSLEKLRTEYKALALKHHPDVGGSVKAMQEINAEYDTLFTRLKAERKEGEESHAYDENEEDKAFKAVLNQIISYQMEIEIIGRWVWCFNCYPYREKLKELGFKFAAKKKAWCWHFGDYKRYHKGEISLDEIRAKYGSQKVNNQAKKNRTLFS